VRGLDAAGLLRRVTQVLTTTEHLPCKPRMQLAQVVQVAGDFGSQDQAAGVLVKYVLHARPFAIRSASRRQLSTPENSIGCCMSA
jgi:hypothetical protein